MQIIETEFSKELSQLLIKHNKTFGSDKHGLYIEDCNNLNCILIQKPTMATDYPNEILIFAYDN